MTNNPKVQLAVDTGTLSENDRKALVLFEKILSLVNSIYFKLENFDQKSGLEPEATKPIFYPEDATKHEIDHFLADHPEKRAEILSHYTIVKRGGEGFVAIPYTEEFPEMKEISELLKEVVPLTDSYPKLQTYIKELAEAFVTNEWDQAFVAMLDADDAPIHLSLGFHEQYPDLLYGVKSTIEIHVGLKDPEGTKILEEMKDSLGGFDQMLGKRYGEAHVQKNADKVRMVADNRLLCGGAYKYPSYVAAAQALPNSAYLQESHGRKQFFFQNMLENRTEYLIKPTIKRLVSEEEFSRLEKHAEDYWIFTLAHECAHCFNPYFGGGSEYAGHKNALEEGKADIFGFFLLYYLEDVGKYEKGTTDDMVYVSLLGDNLRQLKTHIDEAHAIGSRIMYNWFMDKGILAFKDGVPVADKSRFREGIETLSDAYHELHVARSYEATERFIDQWAPVAPEIYELLELVSDVPQDFDPIYEMGQ